MSVIGSNILAGASGQGGAYNLERSLRFRSSASAYLSRTPASAGNRRTFTWSGWVKRGLLSSSLHPLFMSYAGSSQLSALYFQSPDTIQWYDYAAPTDYGSQTVAVFRDSSAWYHIVLAVDTTQATASNRIKLYVNGVQQTFNQNYGDMPQNYETSINLNCSHYIGREDGLIGSYFDGYMTEVNFIDGQALTPSSFGANNASTGVWQPKKYAGTYGTNGFYLSFKDNTNTTTLGYDDAGSNDWTTNNISITAGVTYDSMTDVPTLTSATAANFATFNPLAKRRDVSTNVTFADGNLKATFNDAGGNTTQAWGTIYPTAGKYYWEITVANNASNIAIGIGSQPDQDATANTSVIYVTGGGISKYGTLQTTASSYTTNDVIGIAYDVDSATCAFYKNNTLQYTVTGLTVIPSGSFNRGSTSDSLIANFGQRPFAYTPPTGFVALNTFNLPTPTIGATLTNQASKHFNVGTYTGTGSSSPLAVTGADTPDLVWIKGRSGASSHSLLDKLRDSADPFSLRLYSNGTNAEYDYGSSLLTPTSTGFNLTTSDGDHNTNTGTYVAWSWKANGTGVSNTAGSITSTVSANTSAGFSIVTYTGNGSGGTVGHGLGVAPAMIFLKKRSGTSEWSVYNKNLAAGNVLFLNATSAASSSTARFTTTLPTSSVFTIGSDSDVSGSGQTFVAYCFSAIAGYSAFTSYTGNGSSDGTFVHLGFTPRFVMLKRTDSTGNWTMYDRARSTINPDTKVLYPNLSNAEDASTDHFDWLSNGFKMRSTNQNASGATYIVAAFAENPFKYSLGR